MTEIVVHGVPGSPFLRSVMMGLEEKQAPYKLQAMGPGEAKSEAYLKLHPFGRVPALVHGDFTLYETQAMLRYIDDLYPEPPFVPADARAAARMNQLVGINDWYLFPKAAAVIVFQRIIAPVFRGSAPDEAAIAEAMPMARTCVTELDRLLGTQRFFAGEQLTIADLMLAPQLDFLAATPEGKTLMKETRLVAYLERMNARPSMLATQRPEALRAAA